MTMTDDQRVNPFGVLVGAPSRRQARLVKLSRRWFDAGLFDDLMARVDRDGLSLTGAGVGFCGRL
jgi:hypothetical protein